jgi:putative transcriptional regulator
MPVPGSPSDKAALAELGARLTRLRLDRNLSQDDLAREAGLSKRTLHRMEHGQSAQLTNWLRVLRALGLLGNLDQFLPAPAPSPIQQLKLQGRLRRRASSSSSSSTPTPPGKGKPWTWGDES